MRTVPALTGFRQVPGDKSISHRAAILAALAQGTSVIRGFSSAADCAATLDVLRTLGVPITKRQDVVVVKGALREPLASPPPLDCGRSATTMRLMAGALAGLQARCVLTGDPQLLRRPMGRVADPLRRMGAVVSLQYGDRPPLHLGGGAPNGIRYELPVPSAQVGSALLLAGLNASGETTVVGSAAIRDHTECLLRTMGARMTQEARSGDRVTTVRRSDLRPLHMLVPGDFSSAAPLIAAAVLLPGSDLCILRVGLNPTRTGFIDVLRRMGAQVDVLVEEDDPEPVGSIRVRHSPLRGASVQETEIPSIIDELPLVGLVATQAEGSTEVRGARELRVKETDRIAGLLRGLRSMGADATEREDGFLIRGPTPLNGGECDAQDDHRLAMAFAVAGSITSEPVRVRGMEFVADSFPGFLQQLHGRDRD